MYREAVLHRSPRSASLSIRRRGRDISPGPESSAHAIVSKDLKRRHHLVELRRRTDARLRADEAIGRSIRVITTSSPEAAVDLIDHQLPGYGAPRYSRWFAGTLV